MFDACLPLQFSGRVQATATGRGSARNSAVARIPEEITSSIQGQLREAIDSTLMVSRDSFLPFSICVYIDIYIL